MSHDNGGEYPDVVELAGTRLHTLRDILGLVGTLGLVDIRLDLVGIRLDLVDIRLDLVDIRLDLVDIRLDLVGIRLGLVGMDCMLGPEDYKVVEQPSSLKLDGFLITTVSFRYDHKEKLIRFNLIKVLPLTYNCNLL